MHLPFPESWDFRIILSKMPRAASVQRQDESFEDVLTGPRRPAADHDRKRTGRDCILQKGDRTPEERDRHPAKSKISMTNSETAFIARGQRKGSRYPAGCQRNCRRNHEEFPQIRQGEHLCCRDGKRTGTSPQKAEVYQQQGNHWKLPNRRKNT